MDQYEMIRTGYRLYGQNISQLSRLTGHSRNTIKKAIRGEPWGYREREHQSFPALDQYRVIIDSWLKSDRDNPKSSAIRRIGYTTGWCKSMAIRGANPVFAGM